jgi:hypothetical protein
MTARVRGVIARWMARDRPARSLRTESTNIGVAPVCTIVLTDATVGQRRNDYFIARHEFQCRQCEMYRHGPV